jgi:hypothetical protein
LSGHSSLLSPDSATPVIAELFLPVCHNTKVIDLANNIEIGGEERGPKQKLLTHDATNLAYRVESARAARPTRSSKRGALPQFKMLRETGHNLKEEKCDLLRLKVAAKPPLGSAAYFLAKPDAQLATLIVLGFLGLLLTMHVYIELTVAAPSGLRIFRPTSPKPTGKPRRTFVDPAPALDKVTQRLI